MSDDIRKNPAYSKLYSVQNGTPLPISVIANMSLTKGIEGLASSGVNNWVKGFNGSIPKGSDINPIKDFNLSDAADADKTGQINKLLPYINKYRQDDLIAFFHDMKVDPSVAKNPSLQAGSALLQEAMGVTSADLSKMSDARESAKKAADKKATEAETPMTEDRAISVKSDPNSNPVDRARADSFLRIKNNQKATQKATELATDQSIKQGNAADAGKLLYDGTLTLSELKSRAVTPKFIVDTTNAALALAKANNEPDWTPQRAESQFKVAGSNQNVQYFGSANSLLDKDGMIDQIVAQHAKLGNNTVPLFNKWKDYAEYQTGDPALAGFMQTAIGLADDYAKVMGGGVGTDQSRLQVLQSFANAHNSQQMQAAADAARAAVKSTLIGRIGGNRVMQQMYGQNVPENAARFRQAQPTQTAPTVAPDGTIVNTAKGQMIKQGGQWVPYQQGR